MTKQHTGGKPMKISPAQVEEARARVAKGEPLSAVAMAYGVSDMCLRYRLYGKPKTQKDASPPARDGARFRAPGNLFSVAGYRRTGGDAADAVTQRIRAIAAREFRAPESRRVIAAMCGDVGMAERARGLSHDGLKINAVTD